MKFDVDTCSFGSKIVGSKIIGSKVSNSKELKHHESHSNGYSIAEKNGKFLNIFLNFNDGYHGYKPFHGEIVFSESTYIFNKDTTVDEIEAIFVNVVTGFKDDVEISRTFIVNWLELECSWYYDSAGTTFTYILAELDQGFYETSP